jgi:hypothetical protein
MGSSWGSDPGTEWVQTFAGETLEERLQREHEAATTAALSRRSTYVPARPPRPVAAPTLPSMPAMLPDSPGDDVATAAALAAVRAAEASDPVGHAVAGAVRVAIVGAVALLLAGLSYIIARSWWNAPASWLWVAVAVAVGGSLLYAVVDAHAARNYSGAGVERFKIRTARKIHSDRLQSRERMHRDAVEAWENVLLGYLDRWKEGDE